MLLVSLLMAIIGILGEQFGVSERLMFFGFLIVFGIYFFSYGMVLRSIQINGKKSD